MPPVARTKLIPVLGGACHGAIFSPGLVNSYVLDAQDLCPSSLILSSRNLSLICYVDDALNLIRTIIKVSDVFAIHQVEYLKIGLHFNSAKSEIVLFNWKSDLLNSVKLGNSSVQPVDHILYVGLSKGFIYTPHPVPPYVTSNPPNIRLLCANNFLQVQIQLAFAS